MNGSREFFHPNKKVQETDGSRSFFYEDDQGNEIHVEGTIDSNTQEGARSFFYTDSDGEKQKVDGVRKWWYENEKEEKFQELTVKPDGYRILDQKFPITSEDRLEETIKVAAKDALTNSAVRQVILELEPGAIGKKNGKVRNYYVTPEFAEKILPVEEVKRIKKNVAERTK